MPLSDLSTADFEFFKKKAQAMKRVHEDEFMSRINPSLMRAMYRGKMSEKQNQGLGHETDEEELLAFSRLFVATNTLHFPDLLPLVMPARNSSPDDAALMTAILKHYAKLNDDNRQNRESALNTWFFGIGWKKPGYRTVFLPRVNEPETKPDASLIEKISSAASSLFGKPDNTESLERPQLVDYETLFNDTESPMNIWLDDKADLANCKALNHHLPRTIHDLETYGDYEEGVLQELFDSMRSKFGSRFDSRETDLHLNELHIQQKNGIWICTWVDEFEKPLRYEKSTFEGKGFLFEPLVFTNEPGIRYPVSHMKVASQVQSKLDKLATMYVKLIARSVNLICLNEKALAHGQENALEKNLIRGVLKFKDKITDFDIRSFTSSQVPADLQNLMAVLQANVTEILGSDEQLVAGKSKNDTLGQDELARTGTKIRDSNMQAQYRQFYVNQLRKESTLIKQFSNAELHIQITGKDYADPITGQRFEDKWIEFMTETNPLGAKHYLQGEFEHATYAEDDIKPNRQLQRQQLLELLQLSALPNVQQANLQSQMRVRTDLIWKEIIKTFEAIGNPEMFMEQLDPMQVAAIQAQQVLMQSGGMLPQSKVAISGKQPTEGVTKQSSLQAQETT